MDDFLRLHASQLQLLQIPLILYEPLAVQLKETFEDGDLQAVVSKSLANFASIPSSDVGSLLVIPHLCSWDMESNRGMWDALEKLPITVLQEVLRGLWTEGDHVPEDRTTLLNRICDSRTWSRVVLYRASNSRIRAALPAPPYPPQVELTSASDTTEAELTGPFPFQYHSLVNSVDCSLVYVSPNLTLENEQLPTIDLVPSYSAPNFVTRAVRYAALLGKDAPSFALEEVRRIHANFAQRMHTLRQQVLEQPEVDAEATQSEILPEDKIWKVYTDMNDPMGLDHSIAGLSPSTFKLTSTFEDADIIYSYNSLFAPGDLKASIESRPNILINQFPYEGAFVQKDHLGREILQQHGLPRPNWALETYDLDVQLGEFVGAATLFADRNGDEAIWIIKPARGTQSKGHVVSKSTAQVLRIFDAGGESRVAQRYIENPICYDGRKVDCRCLVMMTSANPPGRPSLFMHNRMFFRIAGTKHSVSAASDLIDDELILTAMHLVDAEKAEKPSRMLLPVDVKTIAKLEETYYGVGFQWNNAILPKIHTMVRELFNGMTRAYPAMGESSRSRALYGIDVMFEITAVGVEPKLTEVTFCPANNAMSDAYERDEDLYRHYSTDVFECLFLGKVAESITKLQ